MKKTSSIPAYERIRQELLDAILRGEYQLNSPFITQMELCARYKVSRVTAERAIDELVREGYLIRYRRRGTFVAPVIRPPSQAKQETVTIACLMSMSRSEHKTAIMRGIDHICREHDVHLLFFDSGENAAAEALNLRRAMRAHVDGLIVYPVDGYENLSIFTEIAQSPTPLVMIDRYYPSVPCHRVVPDNVSAGYLPTKALLDAGHRRIATVWQEIACTSVQERFIGYQRALHEAQVPVESDLASMHRYGEMEPAARQAMLQRWMQASYRPTAIIAANSLTLGMVALDIMKLTLHIGKDVTLASMDTDDPGIPMTFGAISSQLPSHEMGMEAMSLLIDSIRSPGNGTKHMTLPVSLNLPEQTVLSSRVLTITETA